MITVVVVVVVVVRWKIMMTTSCRNMILIQKLS
nr:unnamed protein product [Callosobruchus analis]